jgi:hypothetical protein
LRPEWVARFLAIDGAPTPWLDRAAQAVADALPNTQRRTLPGQSQNVAPGAMAPVLVEFALEGSPWHSEESFS